MGSRLGGQAATVRCTVSGLAAWFITVAPIVGSGRVGLSPKLAAFVALASCCLGSAVLASRPRLARWLGIHGFVGASAAAWVLVRDVRAISMVDPVRALLGALAWLIFAAAWSHPWSIPDRHLRDAPPGASTGLVPRRTMPRSVLFIGALGPMASLGALCLALEVDEPSRAVWARALAVLAAVTLTTSSANLADAATRDDVRGSVRRWPLDRHALRPMLVVLVLCAAIALVGRLR